MWERPFADPEESGGEVMQALCFLTTTRGVGSQLHRLYVLCLPEMSSSWQQCAYSSNEPNKPAEYNARTGMTRCCYCGLAVTRSCAKYFRTCQRFFGGFFTELPRAAQP
mmetsp:Transcript_16332/g.36032  ORF Transcript_16332/g.36032 Transcript_16332/m.36032 type:complete len:109 (-) Transcript_16332:91-417(-)